MDDERFSLMNPRSDSLRLIYSDWQTANDVAIVVHEPPREARPASNDAFDQDLRSDGTLHILHRGGDPIRSEDADNVKLEGGYFCNACYSALGYLARYLDEALACEQEEDLKLPMSVVHQWNLMALYTAAASGCQLCSTIWGRSYRTTDWILNDVRTEFFWNSYDKETWDGSRPGDARLICASTPNGLPPEQRVERLYKNRIRLQLWPTTTFDRFFEREDLPAIERLSVAADEPPNEGPNTSACRPMALKWFSECMSDIDGKHNACKNADSGWRPTRLVDFSAVEEDNGRVYVVDTLRSAGIYEDKYISLSYCWGQLNLEELPMLTTTTLGQYQQEGLDYNLLPDTFKDASKVAGWFGVQRLWIDSMCIIQDSKEDWNAEAKTMHDVYRNALLNISADDSENARGGCFKHRALEIIKPFKLHMKNLGSSWWVGVDERTLFDWVKTSPISKRAWVYQERHLSPRVLHFTRDEVFWECCATAPSFRSESYPLGAPFERDFLGQTKLPPRTSTAKMVTDDAEVSDRWNRICRDYSERYLTVTSDRWPALAGLAMEFALTCPGDQCVGGMWRSCLPHALTWTVKKTEDEIRGPAIPSEWIAPSWSWLSINRPIDIYARYDETNHSIVNIARIRREDPSDHGSSFVSMDIEGFVRKVTFITGSSPFEGDAQVYNLYKFLGQERKEELYADDNLNKEDRVGYKIGQFQPFIERMDIENEADKREYWCLLIAVTQEPSSLERKIHGLLLQQTEKPHTYKRVGTAWFEGDCALRMRYRVHEMELHEKVKSKNATEHNLRERSNSKEREEIGTGKVENESIQDNESEDGREDINDIEDEKKEFALTSQAWSELWSSASKHWERYSKDDEEKAEAREASRNFAPKETGPMSLYEFDDPAPETRCFEKLIPQTITLV